MVDRSIELGRDSDRDQDDADQCDVEQGRAGCAPAPGRGGRERLACCAAASERVLRAAPRRPGRRPGRVRARVDQAVAASARRPSLPVRWCIWVADRLAVTTASITSGQCPLTRLWWTASTSERPHPEERADMKDTRAPTQDPAGVSQRNIEQALMNDQDALRAEAGKLAAHSAAGRDATSLFKVLYQAAARGEATIPWASQAPN